MLTITRMKLVTILIFISNIAMAAQSCPKGEHWVNQHHRNAYYRYDGTFVSATEVNAHCRKNPKGYDKWHALLSNGRPHVWGYKAEKSQKWTTEEIERVFEALSTLPDNILNQYVKNIYRMKNSLHVGNAATTNFDEIVLYDSSFNEKQNLARVLAHELAHVIYSNFVGDKRDSYEMAADWMQLDIGSGQKMTITKSTRSFVEKDGEISPDEDFANNVEYFLFDPEKLKAKSNGIYHWIQNAFGSEFKLGSQK